MMTKQRKIRLTRKIQESRGRLISEHPYFAILLMYLKFVAVPKMKKISTNGKCIYFSPDFLEKLYSDELDFILCHQIMHIVLGHIWRPYDLKGDDYHYACDMIVNTILEECFNQERFTHLGYLYKNNLCMTSDPFKLTPEIVYDSLPYSLYMFDEHTRNRYLADSDSFWDQKEDEGYFGEIVLDLNDMDGRLKAFASKHKESATTEGEEDGGGGTDIEGDSAGEGATKQEWRLRAAIAASTMQNIDPNQTFGNLPKFAERIIKKIKEPKLDWKTILNNFVQERISDYSFSPPDRRFIDTDLFLPDFNEKEFVVRDILFMVDTSGSIDDDQLAMVYSEIRGAITQFNGVLIGKIGFFDTQVTEPLPFESVDDIIKITPYGGGGTDFEVIFDYIREQNNDLPACVVIFTDGYGPYPSVKDTMSIPVLWIINNSKVTPPFGQVARTQQGFSED